MDAVTLGAVLTSLDGRLADMKYPENCNQFVADYNRLVEEAKKIFPREEYIQSFTPLEGAQATEGGEGEAQARERVLEQLRMKAGLLKAYVSSEVAKEKKKTSVY